MKKLLTLLLLLSIVPWALSQDLDGMKPVSRKIKAIESKFWAFKQIQPFQTVIAADRMSIPAELKSASWGLVPNFTAIQEVESEKPSFLDVKIPRPDGTMITARVYKVQVGSSTMEIRLSDGSVLSSYGGAFYRGIVAGDYNSLVALSFFEDHVRGFISTAEGNMVLGPLEPREDRDTHIFYNDNTIKHLNELTCDMEDTEAGEHEQFAPSKQRALGDCIKIWWEVDYDIFLDRGGVGNTVNWMNGMANEVYTLYENESLNMETSVVNVWQVPSPYTGNNTTERLNSFQINNGVLDGDLAHYVNLMNIGGKAAGFSGICNPNYNESMCYSGLPFTTYENVPTYSFPVYLCAHEMGHLLGSRHTHACVWNGNNTAIDGCAGYVEGACTLPGIPIGAGTIMSYCQNDMNFSLGFGPQPGDVIRNTINVASCLDGCGCRIDLICPSDITMQCGPIPLPGDTGEPTVSTSGVCDDIEITWVDDNAGLDGCNGTGFFIRTFSATDGVTVTTCSHTITIVDNKLPEAICQNIEVFIKNNGEATVNPGMIDNGSNDDCGEVTLSLSSSHFLCSQIGMNTVTLFVEDACGNVATCMATVNVRDVIKPKMACKGLELEVDEFGTPINISWQDIDDGSTDNCVITDWTLSVSEFGCHNLGNNTVKLYATDESGNTNECQVTVVVRDLIPPVFTYFPEDVTVYCDEGSATDEPSAEDNCGVVGITMEDAQHYWAEGPGNSYRVSREWRATDKSGRTIVKTQWVSVLTEGQMITLCNKDIQMAPAKAPVKVTWNAPRVDDVCFGTFAMNLIDGPPSGSYFNPDSRTRITYEYMDAYATRHQCAFDVIVPGIEDDYQVKINQGVVPCHEYELQSCAITDLSNPVNYSFTWRAPGSLNSTAFSLAGSAEFAVYADGTARLTGTWANGTDGWIGDLWFYHRRDVEGWNAVGGKIYNPLGMDTDAWRFFEIDPLKSTLEGTGSNAGTTLRLRSSVLYREHGLQLGAGANGETTAMGGWIGVTTFSQNNKWNGTGEFTFGMNCNNTGHILNAAEVIALNGANVQVNWGGGNTTEFLGDVAPGTYTVNVTGANGQVQSHSFRLDAPENCINLWQDACRELNRTKSATANQGSTWDGAKASLAIDGNTDGDYANGSVTSTLAGWQNFWQAELTEVMNIDGIRIWPRTDCCQNTLNPYYVFVSESPIPDVAPEALLNRTDITAVRHEGPMDEAWRTGIETTGKYIKVQLAESGRLQLAEIEVLVCQPDRLDAPTKAIFDIGNDIGGQNFGAGPTDALKVWPNPGSEQVNVYLKVEAPGQKVLRIYDMWGREMVRDTWTDQGERQFDIQTSLWPQGIYKLHVQSDEGIMDQTILIQR